MLDIRLIRERPEWVRQQLARLHDEDGLARLERVSVLDARRRRALSEAESLQAERKSINQASFWLLNDDTKRIGPASLMIAATQAIHDEDYLSAEQILNGNVNYIVNYDANLENAVTQLRDAVNTLEIEQVQGNIIQNLQHATEKIEAEIEIQSHSIIESQRADRIKVLNDFRRYIKDDGLLKKITYQDTSVDSFEVFEARSAALRELGELYHELHKKAQEASEELRAEMLWLPNLPHESVPDSDHERDNIPGPPRGRQREFDFTPLPHWDIGPRLGIIDFERGIRLMGSRGYILSDAGARLQRALVAYFIDRAGVDGFIEQYLPLLVREEMLEGAAQFPKFRDVVYEDPDAGLFLLPTAEVALTNFYRNEILEEEQLPIRFVAHSPCFRRERMSAGRDVRGIKRVHQFEKVERYSFTHPDASYDELEALTVAAEGICADLGLRYRRLEIVTGDLGFSASKKYDVEVWAPGSEEWLEVSSCSNTEDFQARRANIRFRPQGAKRTRFPHTLNGSALALPRTIIAILENYQQADGSVRIPEAITPYFGGQETIGMSE